MFSLRRSLIFIGFYSRLFGLLLDRLFLFHNNRRGGSLFSRSRGNDLSTPRPQLGFAGLKPGDRWCFCAGRWQEALEAGKAPRVVLQATHERTLEICDLADLKRLALDLS